MTYPVTIFNIHLHVFFEILSYTIGFQYYLYLRKKSTDLIGDSDRLWIFIGAAAGAFLGSHILGIFEKPLPPQLFNAHGVQNSLLYFMANKTVVGGFLGGLIGVELTKKMIGVNTSSGDLMTFPLILGLIIGRIGCHLEGLEDGTFGNPTTSLFGMDLGDGIHRHPTNLYEIVFLITLWLSIVYVEKNHFLSFRNPLDSNGSRFKFFLISYLIFRFFIEFLKPVYLHPMGLSSIQLAALGGIGYYLLLYFQTLKI